MKSESSPRTLRRNLTATQFAHTYADRRLSLSTRRLSLSTRRVSTSSTNDNAIDNTANGSSTDKPDRWRLDQNSSRLLSLGEAPKSPR